MPIVIYAIRLFRQDNLALLDRGIAGAGALWILTCRSEPASRGGVRARAKSGLGTKGIMSEIVTANRLIDGIVVFQDAAGGWSEDFARAAILKDASNTTNEIGRNKTKNKNGQILTVFQRPITGPKLKRFGCNET